MGAVDWDAPPSRATPTHTEGRSNLPDGRVAVPCESTSRLPGLSDPWTPSRGPRLVDGPGTHEYRWEVQGRAPDRSVASFVGGALLWTP